MPKRVVIVTGAGEGLGRAYAHDLARRGYRVVVNNRRRVVGADGRGSAERVAHEIQSDGGEAIAEESDALDPQCGLRMVAAAIEAWGRLDALVANAGVDQHRAFHKIALEEFQTIVDINLFGTVRVVHAAYAHMREAGHGRIVVSTSSAGLHGLHGLTAYAASKGALIAFMRSLAQEGRARDVLCNAVAPYAATRMTGGHDDQSFREAMPPEFVAPLVAYFVAESCALSGETIVAGGGRFRRAANVEGPGLAFAWPSEVTPEDIGGALDRILSMTNAREFADALAAFGDFSRRDGSLEAGAR